MTHHGESCAVLVSLLVAACASSPAGNPGPTGQPGSSVGSGGGLSASTSAPSSAAETLPPEVLASIDIPGGPLGMVVGFGSLWVTTHRSTTLYRIDPATNTVVARIDVGQESCGDPQVGFDHLWLHSCGGEGASNGVVVDPTRNELTGSYAEEGLQIAFDAKDAWVTTALGPPGVVSRIDPSKFAVKSTITVGGMPTAIVFGAGSAWVANAADGTVSRIDPVTNKILATIPAGIAGDDVNELLAAGSVWISPSSSAPADNARLWRIDPVTNTATEANVTGEKRLDGGEAMVADGLNSLWLVSADDAVSRFDPVTMQVVGTYPRQTPGGVLIGFGSLWVSNADRNTVWRVRVQA